MDTKHKFTITLITDENTETKLWSGKCTCGEFDKKFHDAIKVQLDKYHSDHKWCQLCAYDDTGRKIAQETFHGKT